MDESHKGRTLARAKFSFDCRSAVTHVTFAATCTRVSVRPFVRSFLRSSQHTCVPETQVRGRVRRVYPLPPESIIAVLADGEGGGGGIYQRVGVYVATNCRVNIHAIRG